MFQSTDSARPRTAMLEELRRLDVLIQQVSSALVEATADRIGSAIEEALQHLVVCLDVDRSTFGELAADRSGIHALHSWSSGIVPQADVASTQALTWYMNQIAAGVPIVLESVEDLPGEAQREREYMRQWGMQSHVTIPLRVGTGWHCWLSLGAFRHPRHWPAPLLERIRFFGELTASAFLRCQHERALARSLEEISRLNQRLMAENTYLREEIQGEHGWADVVGSSAVLRRVLAKAESVASTDSTVLIVGETGTGKELIARAIHERSPRRHRTLVKVNCAALPAGLVESELFGHEKGAFTGAVLPRQGRFEVADGGTILLDEVGELPLETQPKLLRVLQDGEFERLGSTRTRKVDARVIAATNRDLQAEVAAGRFRADLFYRLCVFPVVVPPLRERPEDIPALVWHSIGRRHARLRRQIDAIPKETMQALQAYHWPGNIRELENVIERAMILSPGGTLIVDESVGVTLPPPAVPPASDLDAVQRQHIESILAACQWRIEGAGNAADRLGLNPSTLRFRMRKLGIVRPRA
jgi:transcriptional regulator with GAF, ATPase, and Fis domain